MDSLTPVTNVYFVKGRMVHNLFSVSHICKNNLLVILSTLDCQITKNFRRIIVVTVKIDGNVYTLKGVINEYEKNAL